MTRLLAVSGLILNTFGALLLLWFPPGMAMVTLGNPAVQMHYGWHEAPGFYISIGLLAGGFILQLVAALRQ